MKKLTVTLALLFMVTLQAADTEKLVRFLVPIAATMEPDEKRVYKKIGDHELNLHIFYPTDHNPKTDQLPVFLIIHGGGWAGGEPRKYYPIAQHFADLGMVGISLRYRLWKPTSGPTVFDCVKDGRSAVRFIRKNAASLGIDPKKIIVSGGSAGGHVAVGTAVFDSVNEADDDLTISCLPDALVLLNPVIDTSANGYGQAKLGGRWKELSPVDHVTSGLPPTLIFHSTKDQVVPYAGAKRFSELAAAAANDCELITQEGGRHGYFIFDEKLYDSVISRTEQFLKTHDFLK